MAAGWKRILTTEDGTLATSDQTIEAGESRNVITASSTLFTIKTSNVDAGLDNGAFIQLFDSAGGGTTDIITLQANQTKLRVTGASDSVSGSLSFKEADDNGSNMVTLAAPSALGGNTTYTLPNVYPSSNGQVLSSTTAGVMSWASASGDNLGSADLQSDDTARTFTTKSETGSSFEIKTQHSGGANFKLTSGGNSSNDRASIRSNGVEFRNLAGNSGAKLELYEGSNYGTNKFVFQAPSSLAADRTYLLPHLYPTSNGQVLSSTTTGTMSWVDNAGSGGGIDGTGAAGKIALWSDTDTLTNDSGISYSNADDGITVGKVTATASGQGNGYIFSEVLASSLIRVNVPSTTSGAVGNGARYLDKYGSGTVAAGRVYYINGSTWTLATHASQSAGGGLLAVATDAASPSEMLLNGVVTMATNNGWSTATAGRALYLYTNGNLDDTAPSTGVKRIVAYVLDAANRKVYWNPDNSYIT